MKKWIQKLPDDIIRECILPYTYRPQSPELCKDIKSYHAILQELSDMYKSMHVSYKNEDKEFLLYHITLFMNNHKSLIFGYEDSYIEFFRRLYMLQNASRNRIIQFLKRPTWYFTKKIYSYIAIMKPDEREDLKTFLHFQQE
mgnify:CR=1 FL=1